MKDQTYNDSLWFPTHHEFHFILRSLRIDMRLTWYLGCVTTRFSFILARSNIHSVLFFYLSIVANNTFFVYKMSQLKKKSIFLLLFNRIVQFKRPSLPFLFCRGWPKSRRDRQWIPASERIILISSSCSQPVLIARFFAFILMQVFFSRVFLLLNAQEFELTWQVQRPVQLINKMTKWRGPEPWRLIGCETARSMPLLFNSQETLLQTRKYLYLVSTCEPIPAYLQVTIVFESMSFWILCDPIIWPTFLAETRMFWIPKISIFF